MTDAVYSTFCIDLDCLLDTRFATLKSFGDEAFQKAFDESYYKRQIDQFEGIDLKTFKARYDSRDKRVLKDTVGTPFVQMLTEFVLETHQLVVSSPHHYIPRILINTYPYELSADEEKVILNSFTQITREKAIVEAIHLSKEELTPKYVKNNLAILVMYEYHEWLELHSKNGNLKQTICPEVSMLGPAIYFKGLPSAQEVQIQKDAKVTPFRAMEITAGPLIGLKLLPIETFSLALKLKRHKPT